MYPLEFRAKQDLGLRAWVPGQGEPGLGLYSRAALHSHGRHLLLVAVGVETGHVVINDLHLLPRKVGVFIEDNLVLLAVLLTGRGGE